MSGTVGRPRSEVEKLKRINLALMERVEHSMDNQGNAFTLFQTAIGLQHQVRQRTDELTSIMRRLELSNHALNEAKEAAEQANISKTRFLAAASHDVLQPLNAAHLSISALAEIQTTDHGRALARQVEQSLETMDELLRTLLDISKLDSGVMRPRVEAIPLAGLFESLGDGFAPIADKRGLRVRFRPTRLAVLSDRTMLRRILQNIISNGLRYTRKGGVLVGARIHKGAVRIEVADTGIGIPPNEYEAIFEEFHRVPTSHADHAGDAAGLGLGLAIVRRMVDALSHQIAFRSIEGRGTRFLLHLPQAQIDAGKELAPAEREAALPADRLVGCNVLLAENDRAVLAATASLLEGWGCNVRLCVNAEEAQEMVAGSWVPDIVLADQHLDDGDRGTELIGLMRARISPQLPALLVTADPSPQLADRARAADFELMQKPVRPAALRALMTHLVDRRD